MIFQLYAHSWLEIQHLALFQTSKRSLIRSGTAEPESQTPFAHLLRNTAELLRRQKDFARKLGASPQHDHYSSLLLIISTASVSYGPLSRQSMKSTRNSLYKPPSAKFIYLQLILRLFPNWTSQVTLFQIRYCSVNLSSTQWIFTRLRQSLNSSVMGVRQNRRKTLAAFCVLATWQLSSLVLLHL